MNLTNGELSEDESQEDSQDELASSGNILGEDNMFTEGVGLQSKGKPRKRTSSAPPANDAVVGDFVSQLRSYRSLKAELSPWMASFTASHGCTPQLQDAEQSSACLSIP